MRATLIFLFGLLLTLTVRGQTTHPHGTWGKDSALNRNTYRIYMEMWHTQQWEDAYWRWKILFRLAPACKEHIYSDGVKLVKRNIEATTNPKKKEKLIDTLLAVYDKKLHYFGPDGQWMGRKAQDMFQYRLRSRLLPEMYAIASEGLDLAGEEAEAGHLHVYFKLSEFLYKRDTLSEAAFTDNLVRVYDLLEARIRSFEKRHPQNRKALPGYLDFKKQFFTTLTDHGLVAGCTMGTRLGRHLLDAAYAEDTLVIAWVYHTLREMPCDTSEALLRAAMQQYTLSPGPGVAETAARTAMLRKQPRLAVQYLQKAGNHVRKPAKQARLHAEVARIYQEMLNRPDTAWTHLQQTLRLDDRQPEHYILAGHILSAAPPLCHDDTLTTTADTTVALAEDTAAHTAPSQWIMTNRLQTAWGALACYEKAWEVAPGVKTPLRQKQHKLMTALPEAERLKEYGMAPGSRLRLPCLDDMEVQVVSREALEEMLAE